jgi:hypothetical protein
MRLAATVKEQAAQIQKVSAQLGWSKPAPQTVLERLVTCRARTQQHFTISRHALLRGGFFFRSRLNIL